MTLTRAQSTTRFAGLSEAGKAIDAYMTSWLDRQPDLARSITGSLDAWPVWDSGTVAVLLGFAKSEDHPRPRLRDDLTLDHERPNGTIRWVKSIDAGRLWADFAARLAAPATGPRIGVQSR